MHRVPQPEDIIMDFEHVEQSERSQQGCTVRKLIIKTATAARLLGKETGVYITIESDALYQIPSIRDVGNCLSEVLESVFTPFYHQRLCICGLGNVDNICDSLGPATIRLLPTAFLEEIDTFSEGRFSKLVTLVPNVQAATNLAPEVLVSGMVAASEADCLVLIDAIATGEPEHLCNNIQISVGGTTFHHAGGKTVNWGLADVPVIFICVPTMLSNSLEEHRFLTVYRIQEAISAAAALIAYALIKTSYPMLSEQNCIEAVRLRQTFPLDW